MSDLDNRFLKATYGEPEVELQKIDLKTEKGREELYLIGSNILKPAEVKSTEALQNIEELEEDLKGKIVQLEYKVKNTIEKLRGAVLAERRSSGAIYTTQIPITRQQTTINTTTRIEQGIAFGVSNLDSNTEELEVNLLTVDVLNFKNLNVSKLSKAVGEKLSNFIISPKTQNSLPMEVTVNLVGILRTDSTLLFELNDHQLVEIYRNGELIIEKSLLKGIVVPVDIKTQTVTIRAYPSIHRTVSLFFKRIGYTELIYNTATYFETKNVSINKDFYQLVVDTCDNSSDKNIQINYEISINDEEYQAFTPVSKHSVLEKQSIITTSKSQILNMSSSKMVKHSEGDYRFYIPDTYQLNFIYKNDFYLRNLKRIKDKELYIVVKQDVQLDRQAIVTNNAYDLFINDKRILNDDLKLYKGIYKLYSKYNIEDSLKPINIEYLENLLGTDNMYIEKYSKEILTDGEGNKFITLHNKEFTTSFDSEGYGYFPGLKPKRKISTVKIKAELISIDNKTVPFISRILIRGI